MSADLSLSRYQVSAPQRVEGDANIAAVAALLADPARATMLLALADGRALPAGELAHHAHIAPSTASAHLRRLVESGFVTAESWGRYRYFRLTSGPLREAIEALAVAAPPMPVRSLRQADRAVAVRYARTCYDHLAGYVGVRLTEAMVANGSALEAEGGYQLTPQGKERLRMLGVACSGLRRPVVIVPYHIDWSERRNHFAGPLAVALTRVFFERQWITRVPSSRAVRLTDAGHEAFRTQLGMTL